MAVLAATWQHQVYGCVDRITRKEAVGWLVGPKEAFPAKVGLYLDDLLVRSAWADKPDTANTVDVAYSFQIPLREIWDFCSTSTKVTIRHDGTPIPFARKGIYKRPGGEGKYSLLDLSRKMEKGYVFTDGGRLQLSKKLDLEWQSQVVDLYRRMGEVIREAHGHEPFVIYGSLLGQVREQGFIAHDNDFDAAYVSLATSGDEAARELHEISLTLIEAGFDVETRRTALHVHAKLDPELRVDLFHLYFDESGTLQMPFGHAGTTPLTRDAWLGVEAGSMGEHEVLVPKNAVRWVEHIYGEQWETPIAGFNWNRARVGWAKEAHLPDSLKEAGYWQNFYAHHAYTEGSKFFEFVDGQPDLPSTILDIGCGDGRDSIAFARSGRRVIGVDRSSMAVDHATERARSADLGDRARFQVVDLADGDRLRLIIQSARSASSHQPIVFYLRFLLHSVPASVQESIMSTVASTSVEGDVFAAEFRTDKDEDKSKVHGKHYRRYQTADEFSRKMSARYGFSVGFQAESTGFSPYGDEDPVLYRVIARRPSRLRSELLMQRDRVSRARQSCSRLLKGGRGLLRRWLR